MQKTNLDSGSEFLQSDGSGNSTAQGHVMHAVRAADGGYFVKTRAGVAVFSRSRCDARWTDKSTARRLRTVLASKGFVVRVVSIND